MENIVKYYGGIDAELRRRRWLVTATLVFAAVVSVGTAVASFLFVRQSRDTVYVVDKGSTIMATIAAGDIQRDLEVEDHVRRFHELLFNLAPSTESQRRNLEQALHMADRSAYDFVSECRLSDVPRSRSNPHGLMVEKFSVKRYESLGTRKRR